MLAFWKELNPMSAIAEREAEARPEKKKFTRRLAADRSQALRRAVQLGFAALNGLLGIQFYLWVRYYERGGQGLAAPRPAGVEGWLPIAGLMNTKYLFLTGHAPAIHPAAMVLFLAFVLMSLLLKKAFCSWLCPVGTLSEYLWKLGQRLFRRNAAFPAWLDIPLRGLKYLLLGFFVFIIGAMSAEALQEFMGSPYGLLADVKMLNFFRNMGGTAAIVIAMLVVLSMLVKNFWCRYLCPYGALLGLVSLLSPAKIRRDEEACIDCGKCAKACPAGLKVDKLVQISSPECTACMACVSVCSTQDALQFALPPARKSAHRWKGRVVGPAMAAGVMAGIFFALILTAKVTGHWQTNLPRQVYLELVPQVSSLSHPGY
jgi:polyferredoxin